MISAGFGFLERFKTEESPRPLLVCFTLPAGLPGIFHDHVTLEPRTVRREGSVGTARWSLTASLKNQLGAVPFRKKGLHIKCIIYFFSLYFFSFIV